MYAVIFKAEIKELDDTYPDLSAHLRDLALKKYGCVEFISMTEGPHEIAISYWETQEQITQWKNDPEHLLAQQKGKEKLYQSYRVQVVEIIREYTSSP